MGVTSLLRSSVRLRNLNSKPRLALDIEDAVLRVGDIDGDREFVVRRVGLLRQRRHFDLVGEGADHRVIELELHLAAAAIRRDLDRQLLEQLAIFIKLHLQRHALGAVGADDGGQLALPARDDPARRIHADDADIGDFLPGIGRLEPDGVNRRGPRPGRPLGVEFPRVVRRPKAAGCRRPAARGSDPRFAAWNRAAVCRRPWAAPRRDRAGPPLLR